ncbi:PREDICTED: uncharacterized protein LOC101807612 isoform X2 [Ficedula albicollis]|uniref:uncharacterized protein LOC101807612 isoform X2 n=1 Tax=Ficedula albicollis TaxID=59894 RepID=UPI0007AD8C0A|nr:PREDICTED: uncharacterized protein LOC101807612 isoform X2 [Ficedula albicollis]
MLVLGAVQILRSAECCLGLKSLLNIHSRNSYGIRGFGLEGTSEITPSQPPCHGQGHLPWSKGCKGPFFPLPPSSGICQTLFTITGCSDSASHLCVLDSRKEEIIHLSVTTTATLPELFLGLTLPLKKREQLVLLSPPKHSLIPHF